MGGEAGHAGGRGGALHDGAGVVTPQVPSVWQSAVVRHVGRGSLPHEQWAVATSNCVGYWSKVASRQGGSNPPRDGRARRAPIRHRSGRSARLATVTAATGSAEVREAPQQPRRLDSRTDNRRSECTLSETQPDCSCMNRHTRSSPCSTVKARSTFDSLGSFGDLRIRSRSPSGRARMNSPCSFGCTIARFRNPPGRRTVFPFRCSCTALRSTRKSPVGPTPECLQNRSSICSGRGRLGRRTTRPRWCGCDYRRRAMDPRLRCARDRRQSYLPLPMSPHRPRYRSSRRSRRSHLPSPTLRRRIRPPERHRSEAPSPRSMIRRTKVRKPLLHPPRRHPHRRPLVRRSQTRWAYRCYIRSTMRSRGAAWRRQRPTAGPYRLSLSPRSNPGHFSSIAAPKQRRSSHFIDR